MNDILYIFNPENDMALANNTIYYKAPNEIIRMGKDLEVLPVWYATGGAAVKVDDIETVSSFLSQYRKMGLLRFVSLVDDFRNQKYMPWGWNVSLIHTLSCHGVSGEYYPSFEGMKDIRRLSGRQICIDVMRKFYGLEYICGSSLECFSLDEVKSSVGLNDCSILKSPWSGSGRGVMKIESSNIDDNLKGWISRIIRTQGSIMVEPLFNKVLDFAMEFQAAKDHVGFVGYSIFDTDSQGNYKCNVLASNESIEADICRYVSKLQLLEIKERLVDTFNDMLIGHYEGFFGVDMMVCLHENSYLIHPCVEVNLRMNMGVAARIIFDNYVDQRMRGYYCVEHFFSEGEAVEFSKKMRDEHPSIVDNGKFISGYFPLTPVLKKTRFHIYLLL